MIRLKNFLKEKLEAKNFFKFGFLLVTYIFILIHIDTVIEWVNQFKLVLTPFVIGFIIAYLMNPIVNIIEKGLGKLFKRKVLKGISLSLAYILVFSCIMVLIVSFVPQLWTSVDYIIHEIPGALEKGYNWVETEGIGYIESLTNRKWEMQEIIELGFGNFNEFVKKIGENLDKILMMTKSFTTFLFHSFLGILISIYMLMNKDLYKGQCKKMLFAFLKEDTAMKSLYFFRGVHYTFSRFLLARIVDSAIIGVLCYLGCIIFNWNNALLIGFIVGVTNVIPYFGPFIGAIPSALIVLLQSPLDMLVFCIFILVLQQFDGNILGPKLLGDSLGLTSLWIIFAVMITTVLFGLVGMIIGVPLFAIIYMFIRDLIYMKLNIKNLSIDTEDYIDSSMTLDSIKKEGPIINIKKGGFE